MATRPRHDDHLVRPRLRRGRHARRQDRPHRPLVRQPEEPARGGLGRPRATSCSSPTATATTWATRSPSPARLRPAWPCIHEMSLWLARRLPGGSDQVDRDEQGRDGRRSAGCAVTMVGGRPLRRRLEPGRRRARSTSASRPASSSRWRTGSASTTPATPRSSPTCASSASSTARTSRSCRSAATTRWARARRRWRSSCSASEHVLPIHYGTFPILAGTPDELRAELAAARPRGGRGPRARPGRDPELILGGSGCRPR